MWIDLPDADGKIGVHAAISKWVHHRAVAIDELESALDEVYELMIGHTVLT